MRREVEVRHLVGARHIVARLGWPGISRVHYHVRSDPSFPRPVFRAMEGAKGGFHFWHWPDVQAWAEAGGRPVQVPATGEPEAGDGPELVDVDQLVVARTIAERLGLSGSWKVHYCVSTDAGFPRPVLEAMPGLRGGVHVWNWPDVETWARTRDLPLQGS